MQTHPTHKSKLQLDSDLNVNGGSMKVIEEKKRWNVGECAFDLGGEGFCNKTKYTNHLKKTFVFKTRCHRQM